MVKKAVIAAALISLSVFLVACNGVPLQTESTANTDNSSPTPIQTEVSTVATLPPIPSTDNSAPADTTLASETEVVHSPMYIDGLEVEEVIQYFNEVCLDAEIINSGNAHLLQKWNEPIYYKLNGDPTQQDINVVNNFTNWLNTIDGFPGIYEAQDSQNANLQIHFCTQTDMLTLMGEGFTGLDGAVTFWYANDIIYNAIICCRTDLSQVLRNSVILEEIYNGLGPIQDTQLRPDSIIYSGYSEPQHLTDIDELILKLLYHPQLQCGMTAAECENAIRQLYY